MDNTAVVKNVTIKDLFPCKSYITILTANLISRFGDSLDAIAYGWMVYMLTGSKILMGTIFAINAVPNIIFSPFAGTMVDRLKKKKVVVIGYVGRGIIVSITALLFMMGMLKPWYLFIFTFTNSTFETFTGPAHAALMPLLIPKELFLTAASFSSSAYKFAELIGAGAAGVIIAVFKIYGAIFIDGLTFFAAAFLIFFIKVQENKGKNEAFTAKAYFTELKEGFLFIGNQRIILITMILFAIINFCLAPINVFEAVFVKDILKGGPEILSLLGVAITVGTILGGLVVGQIGSRIKMPLLIIPGLVLTGASYALLYLPGNAVSGTAATAVTVAAYTMLGFLMPPVTSPINAYIMTNTPKGMMGRVMSVLTMISFCAIPLGSAVAGAASAYIPISMQFLIMGIIIVCTSLLISFNKDFRKA